MIAAYGLHSLYKFFSKAYELIVYTDNFLEDKNYQQKMNNKCKERLSEFKYLLDENIPAEVKELKKLVEINKSICPQYIFNSKRNKH